MHPLVADGKFPTGESRWCVPRRVQLMKHFNIWQWTDYVRVLGDDVARSAMEAHLSSGCARCQRTVNVLRERGRHGAGRGRLRAACNTRSGMRRRSTPCPDPKKSVFPRLVARLVHDSIREPLPAGMRAQDSLSRHALYEAGSYCLDLQLEHSLRPGWSR